MDSTLLIALLGSATFGSILTILATKNKNKAETNKFNAEASNLMSESFGHIVNTLQKQIDFQGAQIESQSNKINAMQQRELQLLKIISANQDIEKELRSELIEFGDKLAKCMSTKKL